MGKLTSAIVSTTESQQNEIQSFFNMVFQKLQLPADGLQKMGLPQPLTRNDSPFVADFIKLSSAYNSW